MDEQVLDQLLKDEEDIALLDNSVFITETILPEDIIDNLISFDSFLSGSKLIQGQIKEVN